MLVPLHGTGGGLDPGAMAVGALVGVGIWRAIRWVSLRQSARRGDSR